MLDSIRGKTIRWTFTDGPVANKQFEHTFQPDGSVKWRMSGGGKGGESGAPKYEAANLGNGVHAVSYLAPSGYTLTVVLDERSGQCVGFASNEKELTLQHGTWETVEPR
jgi:hypothetical protein